VPVFALTKGPAQVLTQSASGTQFNEVTDTSNNHVTIFPTIQGYTLSYSYEDKSFQQESGDEAALVYCYNPPNSTQPPLWVALQISDSVTSEHRWETCLINFPLSTGEEVTVRQLDLRDIQLESNPPMTGRYFAFQYISNNQTEVVLYWYETAIFDTNSTAQTKSIMISLIAVPSRGQSIYQLEADELPVAQAINSYWQPIQTWSTVALALSQNGLGLSAGAAAMLVLLVALQIYLNRREKQALSILFKKIPTQDQLLIKTVGKTKNATTQALTTEFQRLSSSSMPISQSRINQKLNEADRTGLIKKAVVSRDDKPFLIWKKSDF